MDAVGLEAKPAARFSNRTKLALSILIVVIVIAMLYGLAEGAVRVRQYFKYGHVGGLGELYQIDANGLRVPRAGASNGPILINGLGFRGPEIAMPKPANTVRLAFLGASTTFCAEVSSNELAWPHLVAETLSRSFSTAQIDYVNGGVPGYSVAASVRNFESRVAPLEPDVVVVYHGTNNLSGELRQVALSQDVPAAAIAPPESSWLSRHSLLWELVSKNLRVRLAQSANENTSVARVKLDPQAIGAEFERELSELVRTIKSTGAVVALATFSAHMRELQDAEARRRSMASAVLYMPGYGFEEILAAYRRYNQIIRQVALAHGAILIADEDSIPGDPAHFVDSVHFSDAGSRAQAERVSRALIAAEEVRALLAAPPEGAK